MTWEVLINTQDGHFKYWSAQRENGVYTGTIKYGRIGSSGRNHTYNNGYEVSAKYREKINEGYIQFDSNHVSGIPLTADVNRFLGVGRSHEEQEAPEPTPVQRVRARMERSTSTRNTISKEYETTRSGNIKGYRFNRPKLANEEEIVIRHDYARNLQSNRVALDKFMTYFKSIPLENRNGIREYGSGNERGTIRDMSGETFVVFYKASVIVGVFSIDSRRGTSSVFYVKSNQRNKKEIVRYMLKFMSTMVSASAISIKNVPSVVEEEFYSILDVHRVSGMSPSEMNRKASQQTGYNIKRVVNKWR